MMSARLILLIIFIVQIQVCVYADRKTDSLINVVQGYEKKIHFESDTNYIKALIAVAEELKISQPDTSLLFGDKAYELSLCYEIIFTFAKKGNGNRFTFKRKNRQNSFVSQ